MCYSSKCCWTQQCEACMTPSTASVCAYWDARSSGVTGHSAEQRCPRCPPLLLLPPAAHLASLLALSLVGLLARVITCSRPPSCSRTCVAAQQRGSQARQAVWWT